MGHQVDGQYLVDAAQSTAIHLAELHAARLQELLEHHLVLTHLPRGHADTVRRQRLEWTEAGRDTTESRSTLQRNCDTLCRKTRTLWGRRSRKFRRLGKKVAVGYKFTSCTKKNEQIGTRVLPTKLHRESSLSDSPHYVTVVSASQPPVSRALPQDEA